MKYQLIRSKRRKTLGLQVKRGQVIVRAPHFVEDDFIEAFVREKSAWLSSKITEQNLESNKVFDFSHGAEFYFFGEKTKLDIQLATKSDVCFNKKSEQSPLGTGTGTVTVSVKENTALKDTSSQYTKHVKAKLESFLKVQASNYITPSNISIKFAYGFSPRSG